VQNATIAGAARVRAAARRGTTQLLQAPGTPGVVA
jgi:hypothetical protein